MTEPAPGIGLAPPPAAPGGGVAHRGDPRAAAEDFEAIFIAQMLSSMTSGLGSDGPMLGDGEKDPFRGLLNQELGKLISRSGGIGVADAVLQEMLKTQEVA